MIMGAFAHLFFVYGIVLTVRFSYCKSAPIEFETQFFS